MAKQQQPDHKPHEYQIKQHGATAAAYADHTRALREVGVLTIRLTGAVPSRSPMGTRQLSSAECVGAMTAEKDQDGQSKSKRMVSPSQVAGGALASVTAAYLGSRLGVAGTFWGAGLTSVIISVGGAVYQRSLERAKDRATIAAAKTALTRAKRLSVAVTVRPLDAEVGRDAGSDTKLSIEDLDRLRQARSRPSIVPVAADPAGQVTLKIHPVPNAVRPGMHWPNGEHVVDDPHAAGKSEPTIRIRYEDVSCEPDESSHASAPSAATKLIEKDALPTEPRRIRWVMVAATSAFVFVVCVVFITGLEEITGKPLSGGQRGTSLGRVLDPNPPVAPIPSSQPVTTTMEQPSSHASEPVITTQPSQPPSVEPTTQTPLPPSQPPNSQQPAPTTSVTSTTTSTSTQQTPQSGILFPGQ